MVSTHRTRPTSGMALAAAIAVAGAALGAAIVDRTQNAAAAKHSISIATEAMGAPEARIVRRLSRGDDPAYGARALSHGEGALALPVAIRLIRGVHPMVRVTVNGVRTLDLLVDTGASVTIVPRGLFGDRSGEKVVRLESLCFENGVCFEGVAAHPRATNYSQDRPGYYNGLLGVDLLRHTGLTIDYRNRRMFLGNAPATGGGETAFRTGFVMDKSRRPRAQMTIGGAVFPNILLDTGASFTRITPPMAQQLDAALAPAYSALNFLAKETTTAEIVYLADVCVGGAACAASILGQAGDWPAVGGTFFRNFLTTFDFQNNELILGPYGPAWIPPMSALQRLGLQLHILDAGDVVWVEPGSPAGKAGIAAGATLETVDGRAVGDLGFLGVHEVLEDPGKERFDLTFRAPDGPRRTVRVTVRRPRGP